MPEQNTVKKTKILVVDDEVLNVKLLVALLEAQGYNTLTASNGLDALNLALTQSPDLILLDIMMPGMDGFETVKRLKSDPKTKQVPVIMVTALGDRDSKLRALDAGAEEFLTKPIDRADLSTRVRNLLRLKEYGDFLENHNQILAEQVIERTAQLEEAFRDTVYTLVRAAEYKDESTGKHVRRISYYCTALAKAMQQSKEFCDAIFHASPMHDVGKIGIPDHILLKPGPLNHDEMEVMKTHCAIGNRILQQGTSPYMKMGAQIAQNHHERWDGSGYPAQLQGSAIPLAARIMQICDVYDALRSRRPYKPELSHDDAVRIITEGDGRTMPEHFDPVVLEAFKIAAPVFNNIYAEQSDLVTG